MKVIQFKDVWEMYRIKFIIDGKTSWENFWALKDISFDLERGETLGIIGENGAGKSTVLKLIAGMLKPDRGEIKVTGRVSGLLELGAGFQPELTGRENIYLIASLFGLNQSEIEKKYDEILDFASIGKFINAPVKCYSQGMFVRLAFAIAIHIDPDILLIDDTLAVGDEHFQRKCIKKIFEIKELGKTIIFVTHDMHMLRRLCQRTLLLKDGRITKDDAVDKVIPLYSQMTGAREGVGILEKEPLNLIFNNGRLFLSWQDRLLTPNSGVNTGFFVLDRWYSSFQADWEVKKENENKLAATGKFYQLSLTQIWKIELTDNYEIKLDIETYLEEPLDIQEGYINIMLINEYTRWFTPFETKKFPPIDEKNKNWETFLQNDNSIKCIGVENEEISDNKIPSLVFEQSQFFSQSHAQIINTDYPINCRVLQFKILGLESYSAQPFNHFPYFSGRIILDICDLDNYLSKIKDETSLSSGKLRLTFDNGKIILCYNGINLTKGRNMFASLYVNDRWYFSHTAHWEVKKEGKNKLLAKGFYKDLPVTLVWGIEIISELSFLWNVDIEVCEEIEIQEQRLECLCCQDYEYWFSDYGKGYFPNKFLESESDMLQKCIPDGIIGLQSHNNRFLSLSLKFAQTAKNFAKIINSDFYNKARILRIERIEPEKEAKFLPARYPCFEVEAFLNFQGDKQVYATESENILQSEKLRFVFDKGKGRIYWKEVELTKRLGLYTSLRSQGRWHDSSSSAIWKLEKIDKDTINAVGRWLHLPIVQCWQIRLQEEELIQLDIKMKVNDGIEIDRLQTNIMLSEKYTQWMTETDKGIFPLFQSDIDDDWDGVWSGGNDSKYIGVVGGITEEDFLPSIIFFTQKLNSEGCLNIVNSDLYHRGRVLQYLTPRKVNILPNEYPYFNGKIIISSAR